MIFTKGLLAFFAIAQTSSAFTLPAASKLSSSSTKLYSDNFDPNEIPPPPSYGNAAPSGPPMGLPQDAISADVKLSRNIWNTDLVSPQKVEGQSLRTFEVNCQRVQLLFKTEGRPLNSKVELWHGPNYTPFTLKVYLEDGSFAPFNAVLETPYANTVAVFNTGQLEFPLSACVVPDLEDDLGAVKDRLATIGSTQTIQGGALRTFSFDHTVESVQVMIRTDGRHMVARIEILQGPNNNKQIVEVYSSDGKKRPFFCVFETPLSSCQVRVINEYPVEYPFLATVEPYVVGTPRGSVQVNQI